MIKKSSFKYIKLVIMMLCAIIGVGFVSGAEIYSFYVKFGNFAYAGIFVFFVLMFVLLNKILKSYSVTENDFKLNNLNKNTSKNTILTKSKIKSILTYLNVVLVASAMFAGFFSLIKNLYFNNYLLIASIAIIFVFVILFFGVHGLEKFDYFVISFLLFLVIFFLVVLAKTQGVISQYNLSKFNGDLSFSNFANSLIFACLYVFMNIVQIQPILSEFNIKFDKKSRVLFALIFSLILTCFLLIFVQFLKLNSTFCNAEMPFLAYFKNQNNFTFYIYVFGLIFALLSSLLSCLIGVKRGMKNVFSSNLFATSISIVLCLVLSLIGFSNFVSIIYPIIGVINFIIFVFL